MKKTVTYSINKSTVEKFNKKAKLVAINKSQWLENQMLKFIESKEGK